MGRKLVYNPLVDVSYGLWVCPECGSQFYGGGRTMHSIGCPRLPNSMDYSGLEFHFGDKQVQAVLESPRKEWYGLTLADLEARFPELLKRHQ